MNVEMPGRQAHRLRIMTIHDVIGFMDGHV